MASYYTGQESNNYLPTIWSCVLNRGKIPLNLICLWFILLDSWLQLVYCKESCWALRRNGGASAIWELSTLMSKDVAVLRWVIRAIGEQRLIHGAMRVGKLGDALSPSLMKCYCLQPCSIEISSIARKIVDK